MTDCSICGRPAETRAFVEGALLDVCGDCAAYGREVKKPAALVRRARVEKQFEVVPGYGSLVRTARNKRGESVEELARRLSINDDYLKQIESQKRVPDERTARKLERELGITLVVEEERETASAFKKKRGGGGIALGEIVQMKQARK